MGRIEMDIWEPTPENPRMLKYIGQRTAQEVFEELKNHLENIGYLPDEYFLLDSHWENGKEIPKDADIFCTTDYGASEGIYLDIYLKWYDDEQKKRITKSFITGKTLGETDLDFDRMNLISSAVIKAFHSNGVHARYIRLGEAEQSDGCVMHLNGAERRLLIDSLVDKHHRLTDETRAVEQLLRRMAGSIADYINEIGQRPMLMDDFDIAGLAIMEGSLHAFTESYKKSSDRIGELLVHAAGRPGNVGYKMVTMLLDEAKDIPNELYFSACKKAIDTGDVRRSLLMVNHIQQCVHSQDLSVYGKMIGYAMSEKKQHIAREILNHCTPEMIKAADSCILVQALDRQDFNMAYNLVKNGINANRRAAEILHILTYKANNRDYFNYLVEQGMVIDTFNYSAMQACIKTNSPEQAKLLLDGGMDFDLYTDWVSKLHGAVKDGDTYNAVREYWESRSKKTEN